MAIYHNDETGTGSGAIPRASTANGAPPRFQPPPAPKRSAVLPIVTIFAMIFAVTLLFVYVISPQVNLRTPVHQTLPYMNTASYLTSYDGVLAITGPAPAATPGDGNDISWWVTGRATADIHITLEGARGRTQAFAAWEREDESWLVKSAYYLDADGTQISIPLSAGRFLSTRDLKVWREADVDTPFGAGQRSMIEGRLIPAIQSFSEVINEDPEHIDALLWRAQTYEMLGSSERAANDYRSVMAIQPNHPLARARIEATGPGTAPPPPPEPEPVAPVKAPAPVQRGPTALIPK
jgi:tetratricopeptide (TPR) repeat protein